MKKTLVAAILSAVMITASIPALASKPSVSSFLELYAQRLYSEKDYWDITDDDLMVYAREDTATDALGMTFSDGFIFYDASTSMITSVKIPIFCEGYEQQKNSSLMIKAYNVFSAVEKDSSQDALIKKYYNYGIDKTYMDAIDYGMTMVNSIYKQLDYDMLNQLCVMKRKVDVMTTDVATWTLSAIETYPDNSDNGKYVIYLTATILSD